MRATPTSLEFPGFLYGLAAFIALILCGAIGLWHAKEPSPGVMAQPLSTFSSARAMLSLQQIAAKNHPVGSAANAEVRDYLIRELTRFGLVPQVQKAVAISRIKNSEAAGIVHNVVVRIPGRVPGKAVLLVAHYDSVPTSVGAADDGASVAAILETARALQSGGQLQNDLICLFTDGEEVGLLGAEAFVAGHPWAKEIGLVLNFEYRGNSGPMLMFETSGGNAELIRGFKTVPLPLGNSLLYEIYKRLPNNTDMTVFKRGGMAGLNFAAIEGLTNYHTQLDRIDSLNQGSLQHQGETMLALVRHFGNASLSGLHSTDSVYFDVPGSGLISYPVSMIWVLNGIVIFLLAVVLVSGFKNQYVRGRQLMMAAIGFVLLIALLAFACQMLWNGIFALHPEYRKMMGGDPYNSLWYLLAFSLLASGLFVWLQAGLMKWLGALELAMGAVLVWVLILAGVSIWLPGASFLFAWPLMAILCSLLILFSRRAESFPRSMKLGVLLLGVAPAIILFTPFIRQIYIALTPQMIGVVMVIVLVLLGLSSHLIGALPWRRWLVGMLLLGGVGFLLVASRASTFDQAHPRPNMLTYVQNGSDGKSFWVSPESELDSWNRGFFKDVKTRRELPEVLGKPLRMYWAAPAPSLAMPVPVLQVLEDKVTQGERRLSFTVRSGRHAPAMAVSVEDVDVLHAELEGQNVGDGKKHDWRIEVSGLPDNGVTINLRVNPGTPFRVRLMDRSYGLPLDKVQARPAGMIARPAIGSDETQVVKVIEFK